MGRLGDATDLARLMRVARPPQTPEEAFRAHVADAVELIVERAGGAGVAASR